MRACMTQIHLATCLQSIDEVKRQILVNCQSLKDLQGCKEFLWGDRAVLGVDAALRNALQPSQTDALMSCAQI